MRVLRAYQGPQELGCPENRLQERNVAPEAAGARQISVLTTFHAACHPLRVTLIRTPSPRQAKAAIPGLCFLRTDEATLLSYRFLWGRKRVAWVQAMEAIAMALQASERPHENLE